VLFSDSLELDVSLDYYDNILAATATSHSEVALADTITELRLHFGLLTESVIATVFVWHVLVGILLVSIFRRKIRR